MSHSLIPERPLLVSPTLAASIGLEQALLLQWLEQYIEINNRAPEDLNTRHDLNTRYGLDTRYAWSASSLQCLQQQLPFWNTATIQRLLQNLDELGMLLISHFSGDESTTFFFAINQPGQSGKEANHDTRNILSPAAPEPKPVLGARKIPADWQPDNALMNKISELGIDLQFAQQSVDAFVMYWRERNEAAHAWSSKFLTHVTRQWEQQQQRQASRSQNTHSAAEIAASWQPSLDAQEILQQMGIHKNFIADAVPEFVLYWQERGSGQKTWNSKFVSHVKRQWASFTHTLKNDTEPRPIEESWQPGSEVFDILALANIDAEFAHSLVPEFVMYWRDRNELHHSWNTRFLQFVKQQWSRSHFPKETADGKHRQNPAARKTRNISLEERLTDRSWAN